MSVIVFAGPSVYGLTPDLFAGVQRRPPAACGDVTRAIRDGATTIALIDGTFETTASVWHKELLWALSRGVHVVGSSSMGALRAVEMQKFGMRGVGLVYRLYSRGSIIDDDEVALTYGPADLNYPPATEAMVNIRATLRRIRRLGLIGLETEQSITKLAKSLYYKERTYGRILDIVCTSGSISANVLELTTIIDKYKRDIKREDASFLLSRLSCDRPTNSKDSQPKFSRTVFWDRFIRKLHWSYETLAPHHTLS
jgi:hypothetical protein